MSIGDNNASIALVLPESTASFRTDEFDDQPLISLADRSSESPQVPLGHHPVSVIITRFVRGCQ